MSRFLIREVASLLLPRNFCVLCLAPGARPIFAAEPCFGAKMSTSTATFSNNSATSAPSSNNTSAAHPTTPSAGVQPAPVRASTAVRSRAWVFTINNPTAEDIEGVKRFGRTCVRMIAASERVTTPHIQGYCERRNAVSMATMANALPRAHLEVRKGTALQAWEYCEKQDKDPFVHGTKPEPPAQGKRTDLAAAAAIVVDRGLTALAEEMPQQVRFFAPYERLFNPTPLAPSWYPSQEDHHRYPRYVMTEVGYLPEDMVFVN